MYSVVLNIFEPAFASVKDSCAFIGASELFRMIEHLRSVAFGTLPRNDCFHLQIFGVDFLDLRMLCTKGGREGARLGCRCDHFRRCVFGELKTVVAFDHVIGILSRHHAGQKRTTGVAEQETAYGDHFDGDSRIGWLVCSE